MLVWFGDLTAPSAEQLCALSQTGAVRCVQVVENPSQVQAKEHLLDREHHLLRACQAANPTFSRDSPTWKWALIRPDAYLADGGTACDSRVLRAVGANLGLESMQ